MNARSIDPSDTTTPAALARLDELLRPDLFRALGDPTRLEILRRLVCSDEALPVGDVADCCGVHLSGVSRHLSVLRDAGLVDAERRGREVLYRIRGAAIVRDLRALADALDACRRACCGPQAGGCCGGPGGAEGDSP